MHITLYTLTQMPVSAVIKALTFEGLWKHRRGYTEFVRKATSHLLHYGFESNLAHNIHGLLQHKQYVFIKS